MKESCGAILYTFNPQCHYRLEIILGLEGEHWLPFKGRKQDNESPEDAAKREIYEETCGMLHVDDIRLHHVFSSKRKTYRIGICEAPYGIIEKFMNMRDKEHRYEYKEKIAIRSFDLLESLSSQAVHYLSKQSITFYWKELTKLNALSMNAYLHYTLYGSFPKPAQAEPHIKKKIKKEHKYRHPYGMRSSWRIAVN